MERFCSMFFLLVLLVVQSANADDVYNFYFEKETDKKEQVLESDSSQIEEELDETERIEELRKEARLAKARLRAARRKQKSKWKSKKAEGLETSEDLREIEKNEKRKRFYAAVGIGSVTASFSSFGTPVEYDQSTYEVAAGYHFSKYFDLNFGVILANGEGQTTLGNGGFTTSTAMTPVLHFGVGTSPIKFSLFKKDFVELGLNAGVITEVGQVAYSAEPSDNTAFFLAPRVALNFTESFKGFFTRRFLVANSNQFESSSFNLAYLW